MPSTTVDDAFPPATTLGNCTHMCCGHDGATGQAYMDLTGKFVAPSSSGNNYIHIVYDYDNNGILAAPLINWCAKSILSMYQTANTWLCTAGFHPKLMCKDNEAFHALQDFMVVEDVDFQLVPAICPLSQCH